MPLLRGKENVGANIRELTEHGSIPRKHDQIVAIALHAAGVKKKGASLQSMAGKRK
jgi:hypothetical protein